MSPSRTDEAKLASTGMNAGMSGSIVSRFAW
jgi:hypothetical protein